MNPLISLIIAISLTATFLPAADIITVDATSQVIVAGAAPSAPASTEVRIGGGDVLIGRTTTAGAQEAVRGDDPRLSDARQASGGDAATLGGYAPTAFMSASARGVVNGVASLDATGKVPAAQIPSLGSGAKAWVTFNGSTAAIITSSNVSSVTKNGTGDYTITFSTAMSSANYIITGSSRYSNAGGAGRTNLFQNNSAPTTTTVRVITIGFDGVYYDAAVNQVLIFDN